MLYFITGQISLPDCPLLLELSGNICIVIVYFPVYCNFKVSFLIKLFFYITKSQKKNVNITRTKRAFKMK